MFSALKSRYYFQKIEKSKKRIFKTRVRIEKAYQMSKIAVRPQNSTYQVPIKHTRYQVQKACPDIRTCTFILHVHIISYGTLFVVYTFIQVHVYFALVILLKHNKKKMPRSRSSLQKEPRQGPQGSGHVRVAGSCSAGELLHGPRTRRPGRTRRD